MGQPIKGWYMTGQEPQQGVLGPGYESVDVSQGFNSVKDSKHATPFTT